MILVEGRNKVKRVRLVISDGATVNFIDAICTVLSFAGYKNINTYDLSESESFQALSDRSDTEHDLALNYVQAAIFLAAIPKV